VYEDNEDKQKEMKAKRGLSLPSSETGRRGRSNWFSAVRFTRFEDQARVDEGVFRVLKGAKNEAAGVVILLFLAVRL